MEITRRSVLLDALEREEAVMASCSMNGMKLVPIRGYEEMFRGQREKCRLLREMIQALESEPVRREIANWQRDIMEGKGVDMTVLDQVPPIIAAPMASNSRPAPVPGATEEEKVAAPAAERDRLPDRHVSRVVAGLDDLRVLHGLD